MKKIIILLLFAPFFSFSQQENFNDRNFYYSAGKNISASKNANFIPDSIKIKSQKKVIKNTYDFTKIISSKNQLLVEGGF